MRLLLAIALLITTGCSGTAWNTTVADTPVTRMHMLNSIVIGETTPKQLISRWGKPTQITREGGRESYIYRNMGSVQNISTEFPLLYGDSVNFVLVTFEFGIAIDVRSTETEECRATFPPRPPGPFLDNPSIVRPVGSCAIPSQESGVSGGTGEGLAQAVTTDTYVPDGNALK